MTAILSAALLGLLLGIRHAFEPDHLAAVSTLVAERPRAGRSFLLGGAWGLGHTLSLVLVGTALFLLKARLPPALEDGFELVVAAMLVGLGARAIWRARTEHGHAHPHPHPLRLARRSLLVGMTHGLAGSGALTALAAAAMPGSAACLGYMALFGLGSALGMAAMTALAGRGASALHGTRLERGLLVATGALSLGLGLFWGTSHAVRLAQGEPPGAVAQL
jgi:hypothetical protein